MRRKTLVVANVHMTLCETARQGLQDQIPAINKTKNIEIRHEIALVIEKKGRYLLIRYPEGQRWGGLWDFPRHKTDIDTDVLKNRQLIEDLECITGRSCEIQSLITTIHHTVTRYKITLFVYSAKTGNKKSSSLYHTEWMSLSRIHEIPLNSTARNIVSILVKSRHDIENQK